MLLSLDKLGLLLPLEFVTITDSQNPLWKQTGKSSTDENGTTVFALEKLSFGSYNLKRKTSAKSSYTVFPGLNYVCIDYAAQEVILTVTGKIFSNPGQLITRENIWDVFARINQTGLIQINTLGALPVAQLLAGDVTLDSIMDCRPGEYTRVIRSYYTGSAYVEARNYRNNMQLQRKVTGNKSQRTLTLYDKHLESQDFAIHPNTLRAELRLTSFEMMRKYLHLGSGKVLLSHALESQANPILAVFMEIQKGIQLTPEMIINTNTNTSTGQGREAAFLSEELTFTEKPYYHTLKAKGFNLGPLESELRGNPHRARLLKPYREVLTRWLAYDSASSRDMDLLTELLEKIQNPKVYSRLEQTIESYANAA